MKLSTDRILTTHVGSLPRPQDVVDLIFAQDRGDPVDAAKFESTVQRAVEEVIRLQKEAGIDIPSDGEQSKISYATYIRHRLTGFEGDSQRPTPQDLDDFPDYRDKLVKRGHCPDEEGAGQSECHRRLHEFRVAGYGGGVPAQRILSESRSVHAGGVG